jgi:hypothetical protein
MRAFRRPFAFVPVLVVLLGCASAGKLARRSDEALRSGDPDRAWREARAALARDHHDDRAQSAARAAATALEADWERRLGGIVATGDTLAAAEAARGLSDFRHDAAALGIGTSPDPAFEGALARWRRTAAARYVAVAREAERAGQLKRAWLALREAEDFAPGFGDVRRRMAQLWPEVETKVAVLPFDAAGYPELARQGADALYHDLAGHLDPATFLFTRLVPPATVWSHVTVAELEQLERDDAVRIGRQLGARRVVWVHVGSPRIERQVDHWHQPLWRPVTVIDDGGQRTTRWESQPFEAVTCTHTLAFDLSTEVLDVDLDSTLARSDDSPTVTVRTVWSAWSAPGDVALWRLMPPEAARREPEAASRLQAAWQEQFGDWSVRRLLERSRRGGPMADASAWRRAAGGDVLFTDATPPAAPLAAAALAHVWQPIWEQLRDLDRK